MPPITAYWTSRIEPKTLKSLELHVGLAERQQDATERGDAGPDGERVDLDADDADAQRGGGALVAPHGDHLAARRRHAGGWRPSSPTRKANSRSPA